MGLRQFNIILGIIGLLVMLLLAYVNNYAPDDFLLSPYKWKIFWLMLSIWVIHLTLMAADAIKSKRTAWAVCLFIAPIPVYWLYFVYYLVKDEAKEKPTASHS